jgi:GDPmannose 4,6-dehydratase
VRAFITGITGQDGSYLCELLLSKGYSVHGLVHRPDSLLYSPIAHLVKDESVFNKQLFLHAGSFEDATHLRRLIHKARPQEFYHLAGQSSPRISLELPETTLDSIGMGTLRLLEILRDLDEPPKFLYPSSSEVFASTTQSPQNETTPLDPSTPYGAAKAFAQQVSKIYRNAYGLQTANAILYNHESPRRGSQFVSMKVARAVAEIKLGLRKELFLGNLTSKRDWGWAPDYVKGMWLMLQAKQTQDYILATGKLHSVEELVAMAFASLDLQWQDYVRFDAKLVTAVEPLGLVGNPAKAKADLSWQNTLTLQQIMHSMVEDQYCKLKHKHRS